MMNISHFFYLAKAFGLAPYHLQVDVKRSRAAAFAVRIPTFLMMFCYAILVCSIFWKNKAVSEISNTVNWIQVKLSGAKHFSSLPRNAENFSSAVCAQLDDFLHRSADCGGFTPHNRICRNANPRPRPEVESAQHLVRRVVQARQETFDCRYIQ